MREEQRRQAGWIGGPNASLISLRALTVVATTTLALGLGANIAIFTLIDAVAIQPLPVQAPHELYRLGADDNCCVNSGVQSEYSLFSYELYTHLRDQVTEFGALAGFQASLQPMTLRRVGTEIAESSISEYVSANYFQTLGVAPAAGRLLEAADDGAGAEPVFVMSYQLWRDQFAADPAVVGAPFALGGMTVTLAGVAEERFFGETRRANPPGVFLPLGLEPRMRGAASMLAKASQDWLRIIGRLPEAGRPAIAQTQADTALRQWLSAQTFPSAEEREGIPRTRTPIVSASAGVETLRMQFQEPLTLLLVMSGLVLLIAAANLANLLIAHSDRGHAAIRVALGASPARLVRQSMAEGVVLSLVGAVAGVFVAALATRVLVALAFPSATASPVDVTPSAMVLAFAVLLALVTGVLLSAAPALAMYFDTLGTKVLRGRAPDERDAPSAPMVATVNQAFVTRFFPTEDPIGQRLGIGGPSRARDYEIVGVVEDVKYSGADRPTRPMIFLPDFQLAPGANTLGSTAARSTLLRAVSIHASVGSGALEPLLRQAIARVDPNVTIVRVVPMSDQVAGNFRTNRLMAGLTSAYGVLALALAFLGLYAVTSYTVAGRTREIGIRMALGADARSAQLLTIAVRPSGRR